MMKRPAAIAMLSNTDKHNNTLNNTTTCLSMVNWSSQSSSRSDTRVVADNEKSKSNFNNAIITNGCFELEEEEDDEKITTTKTRLILQQQQQRIIEAFEARLRAKELQIQVLMEENHSRTLELQETNKRHEEANRKLKKQAAAQLEHFACMSHEIRTPLNCIVGMSSLLVDTKLDSFQEEAIQMITTSGNLLSTIVDDVLDFSKLECGDLIMDVQRCNLQHTLDSVVSTIQLKCDEVNRGIIVNTLYGISVPKFYKTDAKRLSQILFNLLGNAIKFSPDNNYVDLRVDVVDDRRDLDLDLVDGEQQQGGGGNNNNSDRRALRIKVKDYGKGIDKSDFDKIFEPFRQANEKETGTVYGGTGLGLPITSKLVHCLGGSMTVDSEKGQWCEFVVDLPFEASEEEGRHDEEVVDVEAIRRDMADVTTIFISSRPHPECPVLEAYKRCKLNWRYAPSCEKLKEMYLDHMDEEYRKRNFIVVLNDVDYEAESYNVFSSATNNVLVTFGNKNNVDIADAHVRGMARVFPSLLLPALANVATRMKMQEADHRHNHHDSCHQNRELSPPSRPASPAQDLQSSLEGKNRKRTGSADGNNNNDQSFQSYKCADPLSSSTCDDDDCYKSLHVLIAEDNKVNQKVLTRTLTRLGLDKVDVVDNGLKAVEATGQKHYDIVFMDMEMPIMDGKEACRQILSRGDGPNPPPTIAFLTAHATEKHQAEAIAAGGKDFLTKPFSISKIQSFFKAYLKRVKEQHRQQQKCSFSPRSRRRRRVMTTAAATRGGATAAADGEFCNSQTPDNGACMLPGLECVPSETMNNTVGAIAPAEIATPSMLLAR